MGKLLIIIGIILIVFGVVLHFGVKIPFGNLPGDIKIERDNFRLYIPITSSILISLLISLGILLWQKLR